MTDISAIIDELAKELLGKKNFFGKCYVEENKVTSLLSKLREAVPQSVYEAEALLHQRDTVIADASRRAEQIIANANETRDRLVHESEVLSIAKKQATDIEKATQDYCEKLRISVHQSLDNQLYDIAVKMNELMLSIEKLRDELWKRSGGGGQN